MSHKLKMSKLLLVLFFCASTMASNILMVLPLGSRSHKNLFIPLADSLAKEGHDVNLVSMYEHLGRWKPLYNDIAAVEALNKLQEIQGDFNVFEMHQRAKGGNINSEIMKTVLTNLPKFCEAFLEDPALEPIWNEKPDVILLPAFMNECGLIFVEKFKAPFIYVTSSGLTPWTADLTGTPENPAFVPNQYLPYSDDMTLWQRMVNTLVRFLSPSIREKLILNRLNDVARKFLNDDSVSLAEVERNVSMVFVNSQISMGFPRPLQPNVIEIGGIHCKESKSLSVIDPELDHFLELSPKGSVLFSLGSQIKSADMPEKFRNRLLNAFQRLPYNVVWKFETENITNVPSNVLIRPWLSQQDVLGHHSLKAFITHGGLFSIQEAVYQGVPVVGLPLMSDQSLNVKQAENLGFGIGLNFYAMTEDQLVEAVTEVIENPSYSKVAKERSAIMRDQETTPLHRAKYWTKYVIRHRGATHLRSKSTSLSLVQYFLLDVIALLVALLASVVTILYPVCKLTWSICRSYGGSMTRKVWKQFKHHME